MREFKCYGHTKNIPKNNKNQVPSAKCKGKKEQKNQIKFLKIFTQNLTPHN